MVIYESCMYQVEIRSAFQPTSHLCISSSDSGYQDPDLVLQFDL